MRQEILYTHNSTIEFRKILDYKFAMFQIVVPGLEAIWHGNWICAQDPNLDNFVIVMGTTFQEGFTYEQGLRYGQSILIVR